MRRIKNELREAKKYTVNLDDCPELPPDILKEFAFLAAAVRNESANRQKPRSGLPLSSVPAAH
jgi:hypothetical protein